MNNDKWSDNEDEWIESYSCGFDISNKFSINGS